MPRWDNSLAGAFERGSLDPAWFNPQIDTHENEKSMFSKIMKKVDEWKVIVKASEKYWEDVGYKI
jgi:hypothetical protein